VGKNDEECITHFLVLSTMPIHNCKPMATKPIIDYTKSKMLTFDGYLVQMEQLATKAVKLQR
jgi:hypothetical protein